MEWTLSACAALVAQGDHSRAENDSREWLGLSVLAKLFESRIFLGGALAASRKSSLASSSVGGITSIRCLFKCEAVRLGREVALVSLNMSSAPPCALDEHYNFSVRRVTRNSSSFPSRGCFRFTGSGDRPCNQPYTPLSYAVIPWTFSVRVDAMLLYWSWSLIDTQNPFVYMDEKARPMAFPDHSWVEVARYAERTSYVGSDGGGYGIWYWLLPGSGVSVNIGRALRFYDKREAIHWANFHHPQNATLNCMEFEHDSCDTHPDALFCAAARYHDFNSIIVRRDWIKFGHVSGSESDVIELILCPSVEPEEQTTACPAMIEHRTTGGRTGCTCNRSAELLSCVNSGHSGSFSMASDYGTRPAVIVSLAVLLYLLVPLGLCLGATVLFRRRRRRDKDAAAVDVPGKGAVSTGDRLPLLPLPRVSK